MSEPVAANCRARRLPLAVAAGLAGALALGAGPPPTAAIRPPVLDGRSPAPARPEARSASPGESGSSGGWWSGTAGIALALAAFGGVAAAARRYMPAREASTGPLRVVGRVGLSSRQSVYLVRVGDRTLILGVGTQGPPSLLGELAEPARPGRGLDVRVGGDE